LLLPSSDSDLSGTHRCWHCSAGGGGAERAAREPHTLTGCKPSDTRSHGGWGGGGGGVARGVTRRLSNSASSPQRSQRYISQRRACGAVPASAGRLRPRVRAHATETSVPEPPLVIAGDGCSLPLKKGMHGQSISQQSPEELMWPPSGVSGHLKPFSRKSR